MRLAGYGIDKRFRHVRRLNDTCLSIEDGATNFRLSRSLVNTIVQGKS
jgi:hypothetical protein